VRDGYVDNVHLGVDENDEDHRAWRAKMRYAPSDALDLVVSAERHSEESSRALGSQPVVGTAITTQHDERSWRAVTLRGGPEGDTRERAAARQHGALPLRLSRHPARYAAERSDPSRW